MSQLTWLPPLNSQAENNIFVGVERGKCTTLLPETVTSPPKILQIYLNVKVLFASYGKKVKFRGLDIIKNIDNFPISSSLSLENKILDILNHYVQFQLDKVDDYLEMRFLDKKRWEENIKKEVLIKKLTDFLKEIVMDPANAGFEKAVAILGIYKTIYLPANELEEYIAWYKDQDEEEYMKAISRPRTKNELLMEAKYKAYVEALERVNYAYSMFKTFDHTQKCCVCLENLGGGGESLTRIGCSHVFHEACIIRWFKTSHMCPLCRYKLPAAKRRSSSSRNFQAFGISALDLKKLKDAGLCSVESVACSPRIEVLQIKGFSEAKVDKIIEVGMNHNAATYDTACV